MGGVVQQSLAFHQALVDQPEFPLLEVAQAAMDQLGGLRRGAVGEIGQLDERGLHARDLPRPVPPRHR